MKINKKLINRAKRYLVGGVDSPVRSFNYVGMDPLVIKKGSGAYVYDYEGNKYLDYVLSWGAAILGHAYPAVIRAIQKTAKSGTHFGTTTLPEIELAKTIQGAVPCIDKIRFVNSGTEAVMTAVRLARAYTGRDFILKFVHSYHGHADYLLAKAGSGLATLGLPSSSGVPKDFVKYTLVVPMGNRLIVEKIFKKYGQRIAAVLVEPVGGNYGVIPVDRELLNNVCEITKANGAILIFDEVITGFRFAYGVAADILGITPDLICLGKIIGGGLPIGACGGKNEIMNRLAPAGDVYQASTFSGNPITMQAGLITLKELVKKKYSQLSELTEFLAAGLRMKSGLLNVGAEIIRYGSIFSLKFKKKKDFQIFFKGMLKAGIYLAPSEFEANFLSFAHSKVDIEKTVASARAVIAGI